MRIVPGSSQHVDAAWEVMRRCKEALDAARIHQWDDVYPTREVVQQDGQRGALFVLEDDAGRCLASVALDDQQSPEYRTLSWTTPELALVVHRLCVDPRHQGRGFARLLMDFAEARAADGGYGGVRLDAYTGNPRSVELYRRRGYREVGQIYFPRRALPFWCFELAVAKGRAE